MQQYFIRATDGAEMALIPGEKLRPGRDKFGSESHINKVFLPGYCIDEYPTTNLDYKKNMKGNRLKLPHQGGGFEILTGSENHSIHCIS